MKLPLWKKLVFTVIVLVPVLSGLEFLTRLCGYHPLGYTGSIAESCTRAGVTYISILNEFTEPPPAYCARFKDGTYDSHYNALGTRTYATALAPALTRILRSQTVAVHSRKEAEP